MKEKISKRMSTWSEKLLSSGAKDVLIKSIAQAIPTYMMSVFQLSDSVCEDIERPSGNSGGARTRISVGIIGWLGRSLLDAKLVVAWVLGI